MTGLHIEVEVFPNISSGHTDPPIPTYPHQHYWQHTLHQTLLADGLTSLALSKSLQ